MVLNSLNQVQGRGSEQPEPGSGVVDLNNLTRCRVVVLNNLNVVQGRGFEHPEPGSGSWI